MNRFFDVVNFNADASCLETEAWFAALSGGDDSLFCQWLKLYVKYESRVSLGLTGATVADLLHCNPEAVQYINAHPEFFQIILRPFAHDIPTLRSRKGFIYNYLLGRRVIEHAFGAASPYYLPPEFMLTSEQVKLLSDNGVTHTFISPERFPEFQRDIIPSNPYTLKGIFESNLTCIPILAPLTKAYLASSQLYDSRIWQSALLLHDREDIFFWRDGESFLLVPDGIAREEFWLRNDNSRQKRCFLENVNSVKPPHEKFIDHCPMSSFTAWMKEFRMLGFLSRLADLEKFALNEDSLTIHMLWLHLITSDILAAVEKPSPTIMISSKEGAPPINYTIRRAPKSLEAEEHMYLLDNFRLGETPKRLPSQETVLLRKTHSRLASLLQCGISDHAI